MTRFPHIPGSEETVALQGSRKTPLPVCSPAHETYSQGGAFLPFSDELWDGAEISLERTIKNWNLLLLKYK